MAKQVDWRNRIVGHGVETPGAIVSNPRNWRCHPKNQQEAMTAALGELGWIDEVTINRTTGLVIDGHMRVALAIRNKQAAVPVRYVELTEAEEAYALATKDPIGSMATGDRHQLQGLIAGLETSQAAIESLVSGLAGAAKEAGTEVPEPPEAADDGDSDSAGPAAEEDGIDFGKTQGRASLSHVKFGKRSVQCTDDEIARLERAYQMHFHESGTEFGFVHRILRDVCD